MVQDKGVGTVTADDVAELAGVSRWTVNRAFKSEASISAKARKKVMEAAETLGYAPDLLAASLASDRSKLIALLVDDFANPHKLVMMERLTRILRKHGWDTLLVNTLDQDDTSAALLAASQRRVDAAVLIGSRFNDQALDTALGARRIKKLVVFARTSRNPNTVSICVDDKAAMTEITRHIIERGYTRPLFLSGPQTQTAHVTRKETFLSYWKAAKGVEPLHITTNSYDPEKAYRTVTMSWPKLGPEARPDILVCENDAIAIGAIDALRYEFGLRVPEDVAAIGFDDVPQAGGPQYRLTTYRMPLTAMVEGLVEILNDESSPTDLSKFKGRLVVRESA